MAYQTALTIRQVLQRIQCSDYVLPAIQREFVWSPEQIARLFDSLMQGYPIGSFLFWAVKKPKINDYRFYDFMLDYHQRDHAHCKRIGSIDRDGITAVLDGQQRLTALNIGLRGTYAYKMPRLWWNNPAAFPRRQLYLNILGAPDENEAGMKHDFRFLADDEAKRSPTTCWYPVRQILKAEEPVEINEQLRALDLGNERVPSRLLFRLHDVVYKNPIVAYYREEDQDLERVLDIFVRTNSGGTALSYSDMLMSTATAQWENLDAREEIQRAVHEINQVGNGFRFSQDFVLKASLMLGDIPSVAFKVTNFTRQNMQVLEGRWESIKTALTRAATLVSEFGFSEHSLTAHNSVLPIAHYLYRRNVNSRDINKEDRSTIERWLIRSLLKKGTWGGSSDYLLTAVRTVIGKHADSTFPVRQIDDAMRERGKSLTFDYEELKDLVEAKDRSFPLLAFLYPFVNIRDNVMHVDHVFPRARFTPSRLRKAGVSEGEIPEWIDRADRLPNLQLLRGSVNQAKRDVLPAQWIKTLGPDRARVHIEDHDLGVIPEGITGFKAFYEARRKRLLEKLKRQLGPHHEEPDRSESGQGIGASGPK